MNLTSLTISEPSVVRHDLNYGVEEAKLVSETAESSQFGPSSTGRRISTSVSAELDE